MTIESGSAYQPALVDKSTGRTIRLLPVLSALYGLSRDGRLVLGEMDGNVVTVTATDEVKVLAQNASNASWTR